MILAIVPETHYNIFKIPGAKVLKDPETRGRSIKEGCQSRAVRIKGRIVGARSAEQSAGIRVGAFDPDITFRYT